MLEKLRVGFRMGVSGASLAPGSPQRARTRGWVPHIMYLPEAGKSMLGDLLSRKPKLEAELQTGEMRVILLAVDLPWKELRFLLGKGTGPKLAILPITVNYSPRPVGEGYQSHFKDEETETERGDVVCLEVLSQ